MSRILIIDDDRDFARSLQIQLEMADHHVAIAHTGDDGLAAATATPPDLILLDLKLRETDGLSLLDRLRAADVAAPIVMITGEQDMQANIRAVQRGVADYLRKPFSLDRLTAVIDSLTAAPSTPDDEIIPIRQISANPREIVGADTAIQDLLRQIGLLSRSQVSALIQGESGTGKESVARALHDATASGKSAADAAADHPFVAINTTALASTLMESELFGHVKGAFTGADRDRVGHLAAAGTGTLFLDEIGDMPADLQPKLLRVLQEREFIPVGGRTPQPFRARLVAASHRDLRQLVAAGEFREDLYYRLAVTTLQLPPLRHRLGDLELIVTHLLWCIGRDLGRPIAGISRAALDRLRRHDWPGNIRELNNSLTRAAALMEGDVITAADLQLDTAATGTDGPVDSDSLLLTDVEARHIQQALDANEWNITRTAHLLGISRPTLRARIRDHHLKPNQ